MPCIDDIYSEPIERKVANNKISIKIEDRLSLHLLHKGFSRVALRQAAFGGNRLGR